MIQLSPEDVSLFTRGVLRRLSVVLVVASILFLSIVAFLYSQDMRHQRTILEREGDSVLAIEQEVLSREFRAVRSDLLYLAGQGVLRRFLSGDISAEDSVKHEHRQFAFRKGVYDQIRCLRLDGQEITRVNYREGNAFVVPPEELQTKSTRYYYQQALELRPGEILVSPFDLNVEHDKLDDPIKPVIRFLTPIVDKAEERSGLLVLNYLGAPLLDKLRRISGGFSGETMLLNSTGEYLHASRQDHEWGWMLGHEHNFRRHFPAAWQQASQRIPGRWRIGSALFSAQRVSLGARHPPHTHHVEASASTGDSETLLLLSYVPASVATAHSEQLLQQLLLICAGGMILVLPLSLYWARSAELREHQERLLADSESRLRQLSSRLLAAQETERRQLSRDLHDELGQQVTAISLDLRSAARRDVGEDARPLLNRAIDETDELLKTLHEVASRVRPSVLDDLGLQDAVESFVSEYQTRTGISIDADLDFHGMDVPPHVGENVYRILQESLKNVVSHAQIDRATIVITVEPGLLRMLIHDHGVGFEPKVALSSSRLGLLGMQERVELLNGRFELTSEPGSGTSIDVTIPLASGEESLGVAQDKDNC